MKYHLTVYQEDYGSAGKSEVVLGMKSLSENDPQKNLDFVIELTQKSKSDGAVHGIITEDIGSEYRPAWKIDPYEKTQTNCGVEVIDKKTGQRRYEGDDGPEDY